MYSEATRNALIDSATELFVDKGFSATSLTDVATAAQVTRGAVYHHFADKRALYEAVLDRFESEAVARITEAALQGKTPWDAAMSAVDAFLDQSCDRRYGRIVWQQGPTALGWERWRECGEEYGYGLTRQLVIQLIEAGDIPPAPVDLLTRLIFANLAECGLMLAEAAEQDKPALRDECAVQLRRLCWGLRSAPAAADG